MVDVLPADAGTAVVPARPHGYTGRHRRGSDKPVVRETVGRHHVGGEAPPPGRAGERAGLKT
jgi:hypothetical protein